jgi:hypothetical protein
VPDLTPFPDQPSAPAWWLIERVGWDFDAADEIAVLDVSFNDRANDVGGGKIELRSVDPVAAVLAAGPDVVRFSVLNVAESTTETPVWEPLSAMIVDRAAVTVIAEGEAADETTTITGRGVLAQWEYSQVDPPGGPGVEPVTPVRVWNFSHASIDVDAWGDAAYRSVQGALTGDPDGRYGQPWHFSNPLAYWPRRLRVAAATTTGCSCWRSTTPSTPTRRWCSTRPPPTPSSSGSTSVSSGRCGTTRTATRRKTCGVRPPGSRPGR